MCYVGRLPGKIDVREVRRTILRQSRRANVGHIGSCLSVVDIVATLYSGIVRIPAGNYADRDRFVLSKGHAGLALYAVLAAAGILDRAELDTFCGDASRLGVHPEPHAPGVDFATGSLGHGLSLSTGAALAAKMQRSARRVYCLLSDAECNEGSTWEAALFAAHHRLDNLTVIVDLNGQQAFGRTGDVLGAGSLDARWRSFGWECVECDGHSFGKLSAALAPAEGPKVVLARTTFGKGVSFMERGVSPSRPAIATHVINWHYLPLTAEEFDLAMAEIAA